MRLIDADALKKYMDECGWCDNCPDKKRLCAMDCRFPDFCTHEWQRVLEEQPTITAPRWHRVEEPPKEAGEYIVAYHPCWWDDVKTQVTKVGTDSFRGKASWAKRKTQRVTHWMEKPEPPKGDA